MYNYYVFSVSSCHYMCEYLTPTPKMMCRALVREMSGNFITQNGQILAVLSDSSRPSSRLVSNIDIWYTVDKYVRDDLLSIFNGKVPVHGG